jgi:solute carrier family 25 carnitine/acylcarnitine transporter 20/29
MELNYYMKGYISGMVGITLSHPIDSIKTHWQTNNSQPFKYSIRNLYRGITAPLIGVGIEKALVFGTYNYCKSHNLSTPISGAIAGLIASVVVSPYERIKILRQTNNSLSLKMCLTPSFLFKGIGTTCTREVPGFAIYFSTYEKLKSYFFTKNNPITLPCSFLFGGISGTMAWIFIYPQDRIKTIVQNDIKNNLNVFRLIETIYRKGGIRHFYSGFSFAVARAILLHSGTFCMMEILDRK